MPTDKQQQLTEVIALLQEYIIDQPPFDPKSGGFIKAGINTELDTLRHTIQHSKEWLIQLEATERQKTGISTLKVKFNQVFGFYIEVSNANLHLVPTAYTRKQTLVNAERFTTPELKHHEEIILTAEEKIHEIEYEMFLLLVKKVLDNVILLQETARFVAELDCLLGFAELAEQRQFAKPHLNEDGLIKITKGRHPVVEQLIEYHQFVPNNVLLDHQDQQMMLITGPNMAGKSVLMRQVALITLLAHLGSYVPAEAADISLTDQIFVRSGAADMITAGLSTFMVEMVETAYILKNATDRSLIIMDEIGRGTSTYDGISIAWAVAEALAQAPTHPKTLFATHYHELQQLADIFPKQIHNFHMAVTEHQGKPIFLYTLKEGGASHSFGVAVATLAGVPQSVVQRAQHILAELEKRNADFSAPAIPAIEKAPPKTQRSRSHDLAELLANVDVDHLTPLQALELLYEWQRQLRKNELTE